MIVTAANLAFLLSTAAFAGFYGIRTVVMAVPKCTPWKYEPKSNPPLRPAQPWIAEETFLVISSGQIPPRIEQSGSTRPF